MSGSKSITGGAALITRFTSGPAARSGILLLLAASALFLLWVIEVAAWRRLSGVQSDLVNVHPESFLLGHRLHDRLLQMNASLLRFQLSNDPGESALFHEHAREVKHRLAGGIPLLQNPVEQGLAKEIGNRLDVYLEQSAPMLSKGLQPVRRDSSALVQTKIDEFSVELLRATRRLIEAQQEGLNGAFRSAHGSVRSIQRWLEFSAIVLVAVILAVVALVYRAMLLPLRMKLSESQTAIQRQERLASLGTLATGVAHEIRNPLTAIKFRLFSLRKALPPPSVGNEDITVINQEINRLETLVKDFLLFARPSDPVFAPVQALQMAHEVAALLKPELERKKISFELHVPDNIWVQADKQQLQQVLINLVQNAADAIAQEGVISLIARLGVSKIDRVSRPVVILQLSDTGQGISAEAEAKIFDPFFSTKEAGTGLGLSIASRIIEKHGGYIQYQSQPGGGTTFSIVLPRSIQHDSTHLVN